MNISIQFGQAFRYVTVRQPAGGIHMPTLVKAMQERYQFLEVPPNLQAFDLTKGIVFSHGLFKDKKIVIDGLSVYFNAIFANTRASTDDADLFLDDLIHWANSHNYATIEVGIPEKRTYASHLEFILPHPVDLIIPSSPILEFISKQLTGLLHAQGRDTPPFRLSGFSMQVDPTTPNAPFFTFERRANKPWDTNLYFSNAPLRTPDHIDLLEKITKMASKK